MTALTLNAPTGTTILVCIVLILLLIGLVYGRR